MLDLIQQWTQHTANLPRDTQIVVACLFGIALLLLIASAVIAWAFAVIQPMVRDDPDWLAGDFIPPAHTARPVKGDGAGGGDSLALSTLCSHADGDSR